MSKKNKSNAPKKEYIPEGMSKENYADAAFRKKVTIIMGSVLVAFVIGLVSFLGYTSWQVKQHNKELDAQIAEFKKETDAVVKALNEIEAKSDNFDDKAQVKIELTDDNFTDWIGALDASYNCGEDDESYAQFGGASIHLQGVFMTKKFEGGNIQYWVYRNHNHEENDGVAHEHSESDDENSRVPIEVIFLDPNQKIPKDGTWVDVKGVVGPDTFKNLSAVRYAEIEILEEPGNSDVK